MDIDISVQWFETDAGRCVVCPVEIGIGPVGVTREGPVCDMCLLRLNPGLGQMLTFVNLCREMVSLVSSQEDPWQVDQHLIGLMTFAKRFDRDARWPTRPAGAEHLMERFRTLMRNQPWDELLNSVPDDVSL